MSRHPIWDLVEGKIQPSPDFAALGATIKEAVPHSGKISLGFDGGSLPTHILGHISGGFVSAMLDLTASLAPATAYEANEFGPTLELKVSFLRPALPGKFIGHGQTVHRTKSVAFVEARLLDESEALIATASSTLRIIRR